MKRLTVEQIIEVANACADEYRVRLVEILKTSGATREQVVAELKDHDRRRGNLTDLVVYAQTAEGAVRIIRLAGESPDGLLPEQIIELAFRCLGYDLPDVPGRVRAEANPTSSPSQLSATG